mgnify:CR=1 FL=1
MYAERAGQQEQVRVPRVCHCVLVALDGSPLDPHALGELILRQVGGAPEVTDAAAEVYLFGSDPIRAWTAARWHSTHALAEAIMRQYLNCRF